MNDHIEKLAREAGATHHRMHGDEWWELDDDALEDFYKAVAADCAALLDANGQTCSPDGLTRLVLETNAAAIRARYGITP